jgi:hypothetical protein
LDCSSNSLTSLRATGVSLRGEGGCSIANNQLAAAALNQFYTDLAAGTALIVVSGNPGTSGDDPTIATAKGYTIIGS